MLSRSQLKDPVWAYRRLRARAPLPDDDQAAAAAAGHEQGRGAYAPALAATASTVGEEQGLKPREAPGVRAGLGADGGCALAGGACFEALEVGVDVGELVGEPGV